ncbi:uncharacterized protein BXIN_1824 [Babesia sp. Xinjiang]|uniref:uncharacterized protein n=1 Tax=Babesia sp. Xinjiang TaxID=462227 RepID=UPI000A218C73|nr:uncharacterized protein BXIN_1824 [Babesia sp. Xinjiang]ORM40633.1 hypothetical protein BXIN_1824 [Babesia sp. Xinjiang]
MWRERLEVLATGLGSFAFTVVEAAEVGGSDTRIRDIPNIEEEREKIADCTGVTCSIFYFIETLTKSHGYWAILTLGAEEGFADAKEECVDGIEKIFEEATVGDDCLELLGELGAFAEPLGFGFFATFSI